MCDTFVATGAVTADGVTVFGKNSDREPNEAHYLVKIPAAKHESGSKVKCTYIEIPQVAHTYAVLLAKPFWIWGAEMGANEHGVAIGNEAVFTKVPGAKDTSLIGMDFLRLALERGQTAREALDVIVTLLEEYGQGGNCGFQHALYYDNSFIIADANDAWVLETAGKHWAAKQIKDVYSISNGLTLGNDFDLHSPELIDYAVKQGWCKGREDFDFAGCYSDFLYTTFGACRVRRARTYEVLQSQKGAVDVNAAMRLLRDHHEQAPGTFRPDEGLTGPTVCMHAGAGPVRASQSVGSMVSHLHPERPTHFFTGTSAPCTSVFKPVWLDAGVPEIGPEPKGRYDEATLYWRHETLHRATLRDYPTAMQLYAPERDELEASFVAQALDCAGDDLPTRQSLSACCFTEADVAEARWLAALDVADLADTRKLLYKLAWNKFDKEAGMMF